MTKRSRRTFSSSLKARVCLELLTGKKTVADLCAEHEVHANVIRGWQRDFLENCSVVFDKEKKAGSSEALQDDLFKQIGQMKVENEFLKKKLGQFQLL